MSVDIGNSLLYPNIQKANELDKLLYYRAIRHLTSKSATAIRIFQDVRKAEEKFRVVVSRGAIPGFVPSYQIDGGVSEIFWDPESTTHVLLNVREQKNQITFEEVELLPHIVLVHELGHAIQWIKDPEWFKKCLDDRHNDLLELDNIQAHELPVCKELGLAGTRSKYEHFKDSEWWRKNINKIPTDLRQSKLNTRGSSEL
jgi:hypothetical protein